MKSHDPKTNRRNVAPAAAPRTGRAAGDGDGRDGRLIDGGRPDRLAPGTRAMVAEGRACERRRFARRGLASARAPLRSNVAAPRTHEPSGKPSEGGCIVGMPPELERLPSLCRNATPAQRAATFRRGDRRPSCAGAAWAMPHLVRRLMVGDPPAHDPARSAGRRTCPACSLSSHARTTNASRAVTMIPTRQRAVPCQPCSRSVPTRSRSRQAAVVLSASLSALRRGSVAAPPSVDLPPMAHPGRFPCDRARMGGNIAFQGAYEKRAAGVAVSRDAPFSDRGKATAPRRRQSACEKSDFLPLRAAFLGQGERWRRTGPPATRFVKR
jgi:hypothetical protein